MAWVRLDDRRAMNEKLCVAGFAARGLDEAAICWAAQQETDGFVSDVALGLLASAHGCKKPADLATTLVEVGRWTRDEDASGYRIHDYLEFNPSRATVKKEREDAADRKRRSRQNGQGHLEAVT